MKISLLWLVAPAPPLLESQIHPWYVCMYVPVKNYLSMEKLGLTKSVFFFKDIFLATVTQQASLMKIKHELNPTFDLR